MLLIQKIGNHHSMGGEVEKSEGGDCRPSGHHRLTGVISSLSSSSSASFPILYLFCNMPFCEYNEMSLTFWCVTREMNQHREK
jgi:hypothetical protein